MLKILNMFKQSKKFKKNQINNDGIELVIMKKKNISSRTYTRTMQFVKQVNHQQTKEISNIDLQIYNDIINNNVSTIDSQKDDSYENRKQQLKKYIATLEELKKIPLIKQRTIEWLEARKTRLTASELEDAIRDKSLRLAKKKAHVVCDNTNYNAIPALKWGTMFESMAIRCYIQDMKYKNVFEFGLLLDKNHPHFGASPDGINDLGIMVEIKCPYSREIKDGYIPSKYYTQMQGQLAVCELNECDYIECKFVTYESIYKYVNDIFENFENSTVNHGIIAEYQNINDGEYKYLYSKQDLISSKAIDDINKQVYEFKDENYKLLKLTPWRMDKMNIQRVYFDEKLWEKTKPQITNFWEKVEECKNNPSLMDKNVVTKQRKKIEFIKDED